MATRALKWVDNGIGLWKTEDGLYGVFDNGNGWHRLQVKVDPADPWAWEIVGHYRSFEDAAHAASELARKNF